MKKYSIAHKVFGVSVAAIMVASAINAYFNYFSFGGYAKHVAVFVFIAGFSLSMWIVGIPLRDWFNVERH
ncbi:hypothetical protein [Oceanicaulis sp. MMSF_3324]|uniref:hypothetical protein n=1 Tax=Oceanicaulis sp. MMSF_3324 TaxID=3046702 RepID=UPI00273E5B23|nr:hypothetical protein [Oceanicaulis sp. MMSF_3324]